MLCFLEYLFLLRGQFEIFCYSLLQPQKFHTQELNMIYLRLKEEKHLHCAKNSTSREVKVANPKLYLFGLRFYEKLIIQKYNVNWQ